MEILKEKLIEIFQRQNAGLLPDEARWRAESALEYYNQIKLAEIEVMEDAVKKYP